jgi:uncharacterized protein YjhX (UPF0386 family)
MSQGGHINANKNAMKIIDEMVALTRPGEIMETRIVLQRINELNKTRSFSLQRVGCLLKQRKDFIRIASGIWQRVEAHE